MNVLDLLKADHDRVRELLRDPSRASEAFREVLLHVQVEEEIFYAALRNKSAHLIEDRLDQHRQIERRIRDMERMDTTDPAAAERVAEFRLSVEDHFRAEEAELFPVARRTIGEDLEKLGDQIKNRKDELAGRVGSRSGKAGSAVRSEKASSDRATREDIDIGRFESEGGRPAGTPSTPPPPER